MAITILTFKKSIIRFGLLVVCNLLINNSYATTSDSQIKTLVEFFSFNCSHCANVNDKLDEFISKNHIKYLDINIDSSADATKAMIMYYIAIDAGVGVEFKKMYFKAVSRGMAAYSDEVLDYVLKQLNNANMSRLMHSKTEQALIKQKLNYAQQLINTYHIRATPSFLINQSTLLEGEDVITSLMDTAS